MNKSLTLIIALLTGISIPAFSSSSALATMILYFKKKRLLEVIRAMAGGLLALTVLYIASSGIHLTIEGLIDRNSELCTVIVLAATLLIYGLGITGIFGEPWYKIPPRRICEIIEKEPSGSSTLLGFILYFRPTISGSIAIIISTIINNPINAICYFSTLYLGITISIVIISYYGLKSIQNANDFEEFIERIRKNSGFIISIVGFIGLLSIF